MAKLEISLLGDMNVVLNGRIVLGFESDKVRGLLAVLVLEHDKMHRREKLAGLLWPDMPENQARHNLSQALYNLRQTLNGTAENQSIPGDEPIIASRTEIGFRLKDQIWVDVAAFKAGLMGCSRHVPNLLAFCDDCLSSQREGLKAYKGELLAGISLPDCPAFEEWLILERENLHRQALETFNKLTVTYRRRGDLELAMTHALRATSLDPLWEPSRREVMQILWQMDRRSEALAHYEEFCDLLETELGILPDKFTQQLANQIRTSEESGSNRQSIRSNLPFALMPFIGRLEQVDQVRTLLTSESFRLLSLLGPGGIGKTRLALESARTIEGYFDHGIYFVPCSPIDSLDGLASALAKTLGLLPDSTRSTSDQLLDFLRQKKMLIILDGFERLLSGATLIPQLLQAAPRLSILVTTRVRLNVQEEQIFPLKGLDFEAAETIKAVEAVQLFLAGARRSRPSFELTPENQSAVSEICRRVEGMPLAILLAGAWVELMKPKEILVEIQKSYDFLQADWLDVPTRQRSLRATFDYSWRLLSDEEKRLFPRLSVFRGGFTREAAERITNISPSQLRGLIGKSLLGRIPGGRYDMHDMVREYGVEKLAGADGEKEVLARHCAYYLNALAQREIGLKSGRQEEFLNEIDMEFGNIQVAWNTAVSQANVKIIEEAIFCLGLYCELRVRYQEGLQACQKAARMLGAIKPSADLLRAKIRAQGWQARFLRLLGNSERALELSHEALEHLDQPGLERDNYLKERAFLLLELGHETQHTDREKANHWYQESLQIYRSIGRDWGMANALAGLGEVAMQTGKFANSVGFFEESLTFFKDLGDPRGTAVALTGLGHSLFRIGRLQEGEKHIREMINLFDALGDRAGMATGFLHLSRVFFWQGRFAEILELFDQGLPILKDLGLRFDTAFLLAMGVGVYTMLRKYDRAILYEKEMLAMVQSINYPRMLGFAYMCQGEIALAQKDYEGAVGIWQHSVSVFGEVGQRDEQAASMALLACAKLKLGEFQQTQQLLCNALQTAVELEATWAASWTLPVVALYLARQGQLAKALEVQVLAKRLPIPANSLWIDEVAMDETEALVAALPEEVAAEARQRGEEAELFGFTAELLEFLKQTPIRNL